MDVNEESKKGAGRPNVSGKDHKNVSASERGTAAGFVRKTFLTNIELSKKFEGIAYWDGKTLKDVLFDAMTTYIKAWEKKNGPVKVPGK